LTSAWPHLVEELRHSLGAVGGAESEEAGDVIDELARCHPRVERRFFREMSNQPGCSAVAGRDVDALDGRPAPGGAGEAGQDSDGGRLAAAVRPEKPEDRARFDREVEAIEGAHRAKVLGQPLDPDRAHSSRRPTTK
jgi:hypothetical protein